MGFSYTGSGRVTIIARVSLGESLVSSIFSSFLLSTLTVCEAFFTEFISQSHNVFETDLAVQW